MWHFSVLCASWHTCQTLYFELHLARLVTFFILSHNVTLFSKVTLWNTCGILIVCQEEFGSKAEASSWLVWAKSFAQRWEKLAGRGLKVWTSFANREIPTDRIQHTQLSHFTFVSAKLFSLSKFFITPTTLVWPNCKKFGNKSWIGLNFLIRVHPCPPHPIKFLFETKFSKPACPICPFFGIFQLVCILYHKKYQPSLAFLTKLNRTEFCHLALSSSPTPNFTFASHQLLHHTSLSDVFNFWLHFVHGQL